MSEDDAAGYVTGGELPDERAGDRHIMKNLLIASLVCAAIVLGLTSPTIADARTSVAAGSPFLVTRTADTYHAVSLSTSSSYSGTLKFVVESAVTELEQGGGGTVRFAAGTFDLGSEYFKLGQIHNITFEGQGIDVTVVQNASSEAADTEPFNLSGAFGITVRDMTVAAGGPVRLTSDAFDFDQGNNSTVERVKIKSSRGRGIVFDGKNAGWTSAGNVVRDCIIDGVPGSGVQFLASSNNHIEGCTITNVARHGIEIAKSSPTAAQPNKKSNGNVVRNNVIDNAGIDGIVVMSSDGNRIHGNRVTNSADDVAAADGIRINSADAVTCDDNVVEGNIATDTQPTKTQRYGLNIANALCNRTVVAGSNDFSGNRVGSIHDLGTATQYGSDTVPPTAPSGLTATAVYKTQIDLSWAASTDSVGVTGYEVWRDGSLLTTIGAQTSYSDAAVTAGSTHSYRIRARDGAGNVSGFSNTASATTPTSGVLFHDGFETGDLSKWTSATGIVVQQQDVAAGSWAARATAANTAAFATKQLGNNETNLYWRMQFKVLSQSTNANLMRFRNPASAAILAVFVSTTDRIGYRNDVTGVSTTSTTAAARGVWHSLQVHVAINDAASQTEVWLDGTKIAALSKTEALGTNPIRVLELGDSGTTRTFEIALDDLDVDRERIPDTTPPPPPPPGPAQIASFFAYDNFSGGVRVAGGDVNGDGKYDIVTGTGPGTGAHVKVFSGRDLSLLASFFPYDFEGGIFVGAGDVNGDGKADIVTGAGAGGGAHVKVFNGANLNVLASFIAFNDFSGGVRVAAGDVTGDGRADIIAGAGAGAGANVKVFNGATFTQIASFFAFNDFKGGVYVGAGDVTGDGRADIIAGAGAGAGANVKVFNGATYTQIVSFFAFNDFRGGVRVAGGDVTGDGRSDIVASAGPGAGANVKVFNGRTFAQTASFFAFNDFTGGVFAGAGDVTGDGRADVIAGADQGGGANVKLFDAAAL